MSKRPNHCAVSVLCSFLTRSWGYLIIVANWVCLKQVEDREHTIIRDVKNLRNWWKSQKPSCFPFLPLIWVPGTDYDFITHPAYSRRTRFVFILQKKIYIHICVYIKYIYVIHTYNGFIVILKKRGLFLIMNKLWKKIFHFCRSKHGRYL